MYGTSMGNYVDKRIISQPVTTGLQLFPTSFQKQAANSQVDPQCDPPATDANADNALPMKFAVFGSPLGLIPDFLMLHESRQHLQVQKGMKFPGYKVLKLIHDTMKLLQGSRLLRRQLAI